MRAIKMTAKKGGTCTSCKAAIIPGQVIYWQRGAGACHADCATARLTASQCTSCNGAGVLWNNRPCTVCDGTGSRKIQQFAQAPREDGPCSDMAYEDECARRCGL